MRILPSRSSAAHTAVEEQETEVNPVTGSAFGVSFHAVPFQVNAFPIRSTTMQNAGVVHETEENPPAVSIRSGELQVVPRSITTSPMRSAATQNVGEVQEIETSPVFLSITVPCGICGIAAPIPKMRAHAHANAHVM